MTILPLLFIFMLIIRNILAQERFSLQPNRDKRERKKISALPNHRTVSLVFGEPDEKEIKAIGIVLSF